MSIAACYLLLSDTCNLILFHMILGYLKLAISCKNIASFRSCYATRSCLLYSGQFSIDKNVSTKSISTFQQPGTIVVVLVVQYIIIIITQHS